MKKKEQNHRGKNVLFIFADQMHRFALGCMGNEDIHTPNLDKLAEDGVLFKNSYSNCPICSPFRINLFSGMYTGQTKAYRNESEIPDSCTPMAETFSKAGYKTSFVGKWHIGDNGNGPIPERLRGGFEDFIGYQCYNGFFEDVNFYDEEGTEHHFEKHRTDVATDIAIERLEKIKDTPFFMCVAYQAPHYPEQPSPKYAKMYEGKPIKKRPNMEEIDPYVGTNSPKSPKPKERDPDYQKYGNDLEEYLRMYYALVTQIDANVGRLIQALKDYGIYEDTVIIFTADHGDLQGSHGLKNKREPYEESSGIPLIVRVPEGRSGAVSDALIEGVDYYPTCLDYVNIDTDYPLPGKSFAPYTRGESQVFDQPIFSEMNNWRMIRDGKYKLIVNRWFLWPKELYNLEEDPYEMHNLIDNSDYKPIIKKLRKKIKKWRKFCKKNRFK